jgi:hypothetical protein
MPECRPVAPNRVPQMDLKRRRGQSLGTFPFSELDDSAAIHTGPRARRCQRSPRSPTEDRRPGTRMERARGFGPFPNRSPSVYTVLFPYVGPRQG